MCIYIQPKISEWILSKIFYVQDFICLPMINQF